MHRPFRRAMLALLLLALGACQQPAPPPPTELNFTRFQPLYMDVREINVVEEYKSPQHDPYVEHLIPTSPAEAMHLWVKDRLRAVGTSKTLQVIIKEGSVMSSPMPPQGGVAGYFAPRPNRRYDAILDVEMRIYDGSPMSLANIGVTASRTIAIPAQASLQQRAFLFQRMIFELMESTNAELEKNMFTYFSNYIHYSYTP